MIRSAIAVTCALAVCTKAARIPSAQDGASTVVGSPQAVEAETRLVAERRLAARVDSKRAAKTVRELVSLGARMGGTPSGLKSVEKLETEFRALGLTVERQSAPKIWVHAEKSWEVRVQIEDRDPFVLTRAWPRGFSPASKGRAQLSRNLGAETALLASDFLERRGEVRPRVVLDDGSTTIDGAWPLCRPHQRRHRAETTIFGIAKPDAEKLRSALGDEETVMIDWHLKTDVSKQHPISVIASLSPREGAPPGHIVVCAHGDSDSGGPGANDNASGVAIVLEIARAWTAAIETGELEKPPIEIRFVIWGTEIVSTRTYLKSELGKDTTLVLNFDQAGFGSTGQRIHVEPDDLPANREFVTIAASVLDDHAGAPGFPEHWATNRSLGGTDSYVFSGAKRFREDGLAAVTMFTSAWGQPDEQPRTPDMPGESWRERPLVEVDYDVHYHSAGDTPENTTDREPENMGWCARVGLLSVLRALSGL